jgi:hypothetical protein
MRVGSASVLYVLFLRLQSHVFAPIRRAWAAVRRHELLETGADFPEAVSGRDRHPAQLQT